MILFNHIKWGFQIIGYPKENKILGWIISNKKGIKRR